MTTASPLKRTWRSIGRWLRADHVQIQQTLINLVHNAMEAMAGLTDRPKSLVLRSRRQGEELLIQVRDHGVGIKDSALVFEPFFTTKESGMGMGLSISRSIVEAHGGRIWATANEDVGTTFSFTLPLASERLRVSHAVESDSADHAAPFGRALPSAVRMAASSC